ncbi:hypothetical protein BGZ49_008484, partial [Haplosporangium sp. Z 27]
MDMKSSIVPARKRLHELKSSAEFASSEFNHSIKTWVNMASLLVKQGNHMIETTMDDENAYISYVRACLIITKIIPHQEQYPTMMNDIVCIDLRQKILGIISRIVHLERRLLKRFEQENQQRLAHSKSPSLSTSSSSLSASRSSSKTPSPTSTLSTLASTAFSLGSNVESEETTVRLLSFKQGSDADEDTDEDEITEDYIEMKYEFSAGDDLALESDPQTYVNHHRRTLTGSVGSRSVSPSGSQSGSQSESQRQQQQVDKGSPTLKKKSSNDDEKSSLLLSPECQPNFPAAMPSTLPARQREGGHVRRCSSTDAIRVSVHFPSIMALATASENNAASNRSDKRCSSMAVMGGSDVDRTRTKERGPDYRGTTLSTEEEKAMQAREILKDRFSNRRTMSFENKYLQSSNGGNNAATTLPKITGAQLRKCNSISSKRSRETQPTPRLSVEMITVDGKSSFASLNTQMSISSGSVNYSVPSSTSSTPFTSPSMRSSPRMPANAFTVIGGHRNNGHGHSYSLTSIASESTNATTEPASQGSVHPSKSSLSSQAFDSTANSSANINNNTSSKPRHKNQDRVVHKQSSSISGSTSFTNTPSTVPGVSSASATSSPTLISMATWATVTTGKKVGFLRKMRSKPKLKDQMFDM